MIHHFSPASLISSLLWVVLTLFSIPVGAVNHPGSYGGAAIAAGAFHTVALKIDGTVWAWGDNEHGQLGDGTTTNRATPVQFKGLNSVAAIAAGDYHTVALKGDGTVWAWGDNGGGQLGDGTTTDRSTPVQVKGLNSVAAIAGGNSHTVVLKNDGTVWAWGENSPQGQLGDGTTIDRSTPVQVRSLADIIAIAAGNAHTVALKRDGIIWAWGFNLYGQLGDGTLTSRHTPVQVPNLTEFIAIAADSDRTVALKRDGIIWDWGYTSKCDFICGSLPAPVSGLNDVVSIATGGRHTVALKRDGTVWTWGYSNESGQLGDGTTIDRNTPVQVLGSGGNGYLNLLQTTPPPPNDSIPLALEEPAPGSVYSGISNVRGWAVTPQGLQKIELYVDGILEGNLPLGGKRTDVGAAYPSHPGAADSGFAMAFNYSNLTAGPHTLTVRAYDNTGGARDASTTFTVARFATAFMADPATVNLDQATLARAGNTITIQNLLAAGQPYNVQLTWHPAAQGFALTQINPAGGNPTAFSAGSPTPSDPLPSIPASGTSTGSGADVTPLSAQPAAGETIVLALEEPAPGSVYSGIANVRGWAVAPAGMQKVELYVDGQLFSNLPLGGRRADVGGAYSSYPGSADSGFAMAFNYSNLTAGPHTLTVRAYDNTGGARDASAAFTVARFAEAFMADPATVNLDQATLARAGNTITVQNLLAAGQPYNVQLTWRPAAQGFALTQIEESMNSCRATLSPSTLNVTASGGTGDISVSIPSDCPWTANSDVPWVIITSGASGVGSGAVAFTASANLSNVQRSGTLTIANQAVTLRQESGDPGGGQ